MTEIRRHPGAVAFLARAEGWLLEAEAEHNLLLGIAYRLRDRPAEGPAALGADPPPYLATVERSGAVVGCAFRTPPHKLGLTRMPVDAVQALAEDVAEAYASLPAVLGPEAAVERFVDAWRRLRGVSGRAGQRQRIHQLRRVVSPPRPPAGKPRMAGAADLERLLVWVTGFVAETGVGHVDVPRTVADQLGRGAAWVWEDGEPRALAAVAGWTPNGARIGYVFTPAEYRGRGYASALVAALSQRVLDGGRELCFLYTDLANPGANRIYARLGYEPVCDVLDYVLAEPT